MRKLALSTFVTLDGVMQAPGGPQEDPTGGFAHGGWSFHYWDDMMMQTMGLSLDVPFDLLLGRKTYEIFAAHWPHASEDDPTARVLNRARKYVVTTTLQTLSWHNSVRISGNVPTEIARLKAGDGPDLQVHGSAQLIQTLLAHDLVDELRVWTFPLIVGGGKRLFGQGAMPGALELADSKTSTTGVTINTYRRSGPIRAGSFEFEQPTPAEIERRAKMAREG